MKISELIEKLQESLKEHGDKDVCFQNLYDGGYEDVEEVVLEYPSRKDKETFIGLRN